MGNRTGGYLGNVLAMPVLIAMSATFFYVSFREKFSLTGLVLATLGIYLLTVSMSTTAILAFLITFFVYELYFQNSLKFLLGFSIIFVLVAVLFSSNIPLAYLYDRLLNEFRNPTYVAAFIPNLSIFLKPINMLSIILGRWSWGFLEGGSTHVDLLNIITTYGVGIAWLLYRRMLRPIIILKHSVNGIGNVFSMTVLTAIICLFHSSMTLNINIMMLVTLLFLKGGQISKTSPDHNDPEFKKIIRLNPNEGV
jgi:hypothetical protein